MSQADSGGGGGIPGFDTFVKIGTALSQGGDWMLGRSQQRQLRRNIDQFIGDLRESRGLTRRPGGPSPVDNLPPYVPPPTVVTGAVIYGAPSATRASQAQIRATWAAFEKKQLEKWLAKQRGLGGKLRRAKVRGKELARLARRQLPKVAAPILRRIPKGAGPIVAAQVAYTVGYEIGTQIYRAYERYAYGPNKPARPSPGTPGTQTSTRRPPGGPPRRPAVRTAPATPPGGARARAPRAPAPGQATRNVPTAPAPAVVSAPTSSPTSSTSSPSPAPMPRRSSWTLPKLPQGLLSPAEEKAVKDRQRERTRQRPSPLTQSQSPPVGYPPQVRTQTCECPPKRKKSGKAKCTNPIVSRTKRTRGGQKFQTITRRLEC